MHPLLLALGESDCEEIGSGVLAQPVNAISSLAFTIAGAILVPYAWRSSGQERHLRFAFVAAMAATGVGSFLYHGPQGSGSQFLHDVTFLAALAILATANTAAGLRWQPSSTWTVLALYLVTAAGVLLAVPNAANVVMVASVAWVVVADVLLRRATRPTAGWVRVAGGAMAVALGFFVLGRTDGPLCDSGSLFQGHALWHVFAASALATYFVGTGSARSEVLP